MSRPRRSAGESTQRKYNELTRSWRRRNRGLFVLLGSACVLVGLGTFQAAQRWPSQGWTLGLLAGSLFALVVIAWMSPPGWIENWQSGAWGEQSTAKVLRELEADGWVVLHDLDAGRGNVDHIVVGPTGVYLLDSKRIAGSVVVGSDGVTVRRLDDPELSYQHPGATHLLSLASQTHERVLTSSRISTWVTPVMVLWAEFPQRVVEGRCSYVHGDELVGWLRSRQPTIAPSRIKRVAQAVQTAWAGESTSATA